MPTFTDSSTPPRVWPLCCSGRVAQELAGQGEHVYRLLTGRVEDLVALVRDRVRLADMGLEMCRDADGKYPVAIAGDVERLAAAAVETLPEFFSDTAGVELCRGKLAAAQRIIDREQRQAAALAADALSVVTSIVPAIATPVPGPAPQPSPPSEDHEPHV